MTEAKQPSGDELRDTLRDDLAAQLRRLQDDLSALKETMSKGAKAEASSVVGEASATSSRGGTKSSSRNSTLPMAGPSGSAWAVTIQLPG